MCRTMNGDLPPRCDDVVKKLSRRPWQSFLSRGTGTHLTRRAERAFLNSTTDRLLDGDRESRNCPLDTAAAWT